MRPLLHKIFTALMIDARPIPKRVRMWWKRVSWPARICMVHDHIMVLMLLLILLLLDLPYLRHRHDLRGLQDYGPHRRRFRHRR